MQNRIKELREKRGWTMRDLAARMSTTSSTINKLEKGITRLNIIWMARLAEAFNVDPGQFAGSPLSIRKAIPDDASLFDGKIEELTPKETQLAYVVTSSALDQRGIYPGTILIVETSPEWIKKSRSGGDIVIVEYKSDDDTSIILRQFVEPNLLITNSSRLNADIFNIEKAWDMTIKGIAVGAYWRFGSEFDISSDA